MPPKFKRTTDQEDRVRIVFNTFPNILLVRFYFTFNAYIYDCTI